MATDHSACDGIPGALPSAALSRREAIGAMWWPMAVGAAALGSGCRSAPHRAAPAAANGLANTEDDEAFWRHIRAEFLIDPAVLNLNNGGVSPTPRPVLDSFFNHFTFANTMPPPHALWQVQEKESEHVRTALAHRWGVDPEEIALTRNASEGLQICQNGLPLSRGDEVVFCTQDYPRMLNTFRQRAQRDGIVLVPVRIPVPCEDPQEIVARYAQAITDRTRMILVSHMINLTGQVMPVREIGSLGRGRGDAGRDIPVVVDGAHGLAQFEFKISDLGCDYYAVSLHKWLFAPHGTGVLYVRRDKVKSLWPMQAAPDAEHDDIRKFEEIGTHPEAATLAIREALAFHERIGGARKERRLGELRRAWMSRLEAMPAAQGRLRFHTPRNPGLSHALGTFQMLGVDSTAFAAWTWAKHRVLVTPIKHEEFEGVRVTPSVYTSHADLERFCGLVEGVLKNGLT
ncbi:MAG: aminotransferase class V-fold PLP-dependent enzyme [Phycisphaerales bacterium]